MDIEQNIFQRIGAKITDLAARAGLSTVKLAAGLILGIAGFFRLIGFPTFASEGERETLIGVHHSCQDRRHLAAQNVRSGVAVVRFVHTC